jgi:hypothetical protein
MHLSAAIEPLKYCIPSDLQSQARYRLVSTAVGDHAGILGAAVLIYIILFFALFIGEALSNQ